jgi:hypothetical protein
MEIDGQRGQRARSIDAERGAMLEPKSRRSFKLDDHSTAMQIVQVLVLSRDNGGEYVFEIRGSKVTRVSHSQLGKKIEVTKDRPDVVRGVYMALIEEGQFVIQALNQRLAVSSQFVASAPESSPNNTVAANCKWFRDLFARLPSLFKGPTKPNIDSVETPERGECQEVPYRDGYFLGLGLRNQALIGEVFFWRGFVIIHRSNYSDQVLGVDQSCTIQLSHKQGRGNITLSLVQSEDGSCWFTTSRPIPRVNLGAHWGIWPITETEGKSRLAGLDDTLRMAGIAVEDDAQAEVESAAESGDTIVPGEGSSED